MSGRLASYADLVDVLDALPLLAREARRARGLSLRDAAEQIGVSFNALSRFERGGNDFQLRNAVLLLRWLQTPAGSAA